MQRTSTTRKTLRTIARAATILGSSSVLATLATHSSPAAWAFDGKPVVECTDDYHVTNPFRVINTVYSDTSQPGYLLLKFVSYQGVYPFDGVVTTHWHNLYSGKDATFQLAREKGRYSIAAIPTGPGTVALSINFDNTLTGGYQRALPTAQCNVTIEVASPEAYSLPPQPSISNLSDTVPGANKNDPTPPAAIQAQSKPIHPPKK